MKLSIIMPALNEAGNIDDAISSTLLALDEYSIDGELVVVNDGSADATAEKIRVWEAKDQRVRSVHHDAPKGIGRAFWDGVDAARGDSVVMLPGDNENDPAEIFRYNSLTEHVDIIIPFLFDRQARSLFRNVLSLTYRTIINTTFMVNINYTNGTVIYRKAILDGLAYRSEGFFFQTDILIRLIKGGCLFAEVPYRIRQRNAGRSKAVSFPSFVNVVKGYIRLVRDIHFSGHVQPSYDTGSMTEKRRNNGNG